MTSNKWNDCFLDTMRAQGDPQADAVVQALFAEGQQLAEQFGSAMMDGLMRMERGGKRAEFHMPVALRLQRGDGG